MANVDPFVVQWPSKWVQDPEIGPVVHYLNRFLHDLLIRTGGGSDAITALEIGELYEPGIQTSDVDDRVAALESDNSAVTNDLLDRVESLENEIGFWNFAESEEVEPKDFYYEVAAGRIPGVSYVHKHGQNPDIDIASGFEAVWNGGGDYTGFDATAEETIEVFSSSAADAGTLVSSGTATGGSSTTIVDSGATFVTDGVAVGDAILNDTAQVHGIVTAVTSETTLTVFSMSDAGSNSSGDAYRVVTPGSTGAAVIKLSFLLDDVFVESSEYVILNGVTGVDTTGTYIRHSRGQVVLAGSSGSNTGTLTSRQKTTTANVFMVMPATFNRTTICAYTIPAGKKGFIRAWRAAVSGHTKGSAEVRLMSRCVNEPFVVVDNQSLLDAGSSEFENQYFPPKNTLYAGTDIKVMADTDIDNLSITASVDIILEDI